MMSERSLSTIGIIGAGKLGTTLARHLIAAGYDVIVSASGDPTDVGFFLEVLVPGARAGWTTDVIHEADVVILALPLGKIPDLPTAALAGKIVIDATNFWEPVDGARPDFLWEDSTSVSVERALPGARIAKALSHLGYHDIDNLAHRDGELVGMTVAGDDAGAVAAATELVTQIGFEPVFLESLSAGRAVEVGSPVFGLATTSAELVSLLGVSTLQP